MADENADNIWKRKFLTLESRVKHVELENQKIVNRIYHVRKHLKRSRRERSYLVKKCEAYGVDYEKAQSLYAAQMLAEINAAYEDNRSQLKKSAGVTKKGTRRAHHKLDPDAPKKPANAFFMFCQKQRNSMHDDQKDPAVGHHELTKHLAKEWNTLGAEGKKVYYKMYEKDKARYDKEMKQYAKEKTPKEPARLLKTKKQKAKKGAATATAPPPKAVEQTKSSPNPASCVPMEETRTDSLENDDSPSSQFNLLNNMSFTTDLPSPMLDIGGDINDDDSFNSFEYNTV